MTPVNILIVLGDPVRECRLRGREFQVLLKGPTAAEKQKGFGPLASASDFRIGSLKIADGTARINFVSNSSLGTDGRAILHR